MKTLLRADLELTPVDDGARWVIRDPRNDRYVRIRSRELRYLVAGDASPQRAELRRTLNVRANDATLTHGPALEARLAEWGLLVGSRDVPDKNASGWLGRLQISGLLTVRYRLVDPDAAFGRLVATRFRRAVLTALAGIFVVSAVAGFTVAGAAAHRAFAVRQA